MAELPIASFLQGPTQEPSNLKVVSSPSLPSPNVAKTHKIAEEALAGLATPHPSDRWTKSVRTVSANAPSVANVALHTGGPHVAFEATKASLAFEGKTKQYLEQFEDKAQKQLDLIDELLHLSTDISHLPDQEKIELPDSMRDRLNKLKSLGIHILPIDGKTISREQRLEAKALINPHIDKARTQIQQHFSRMHHKIQENAAVFAVTKECVALASRLGKTISDNSNRR